MANYEITVAAAGSSGLVIGDVIKVVENEYILITRLSGGQRRFGIIDAEEPAQIGTPAISVVEHKINIEDVDNPQAIFGYIKFWIVNDAYIHFEILLSSLIDIVNPRSGSGGGLVSVGS